MAVTEWQLLQPIGWSSNQPRRPNGDGPAEDAAFGISTSDHDAGRRSALGHLAAHVE
jgi:hypothetical protein